MQHNKTSFDTDLITVVIPCYNHGHYLGAAIESVLGQSYPHVEIVVVDDGATDNTGAVAQSYPGVKYVYQSNSGLSAARNKGIAESRGNYLVFLDADDILYPQALQINHRYLQQNKDAAFVSGSHDKFYEVENSLESVQRNVGKDHYKMFLSLGNYIGVPASVLYRRWVFNEFYFDTGLKACEDYHLYLNVSRKYKVVHHQEKIALYRQHESSMSSNLLMMLQMALHVLNQQIPYLKDSTEKEAYKLGRKFWKSYYINQFYKKLKSGNVKTSVNNLKVIFVNKPEYLLRFLKDVITNKFQFKTS